jgi:excinuclease UvrABC nuclease subunit
MYQHAQNLEFEDAAKLRDQIQKIRDRHMGLEPAGAEPAD